jgi:hypothetical protein
MTANAANRCCKSSELLRDYETTRAIEKRKKTRPLTYLEPPTGGIFLLRDAGTTSPSVVSQFETLIQGLIVVDSGAHSQSMARGMLAQEWMQGPKKHRSRTEYAPLQETKEACERWEIYE